MIIELHRFDRNLAMAETMEILLDSARLVASRQEFYEADKDIYGSFSGLYDEISQLDWS